MLKNMIIAIDGEASSGKSTQAKKVADYFGYSYLDSGAFYRAITLFFKKKGIITANRIVIIFWIFVALMCSKLNSVEDYNEGLSNERE